MSTAYLYRVLPPTHLNPSQSPLSVSPFDRPQQRVYPASTTPAFPIFTPNVCGSGSPNYNYSPNYQGYNAFNQPAAFALPMRNPTSTMSHYNFQVPCSTSYNTSYNMSVGPLTATTSLPLPQVTGHCEVSMHTSPWSPSTTQTRAAPVADKQQDQHAVLGTKQNLGAEEPQPEEVNKEDCQTHEECCVAVVQQEDTPIHICRDNPESLCSGRGKFCFEIVMAFDEEHPEVLSADQLLGCVMDAISQGSNTKLPTTGQLSQVNTDTTIFPEYGTVRWVTPSSGSTTNLKVSASTIPARSSSGGSCPSPQNYLAASSSMGAVGPSTMKRSRSEDYQEDRPMKRRREQSIDKASQTVKHTFRQLRFGDDPKDHGDLSENRNPVDSGTKDFAKKEKLLCLLCFIFKGSYSSLSRKDSLKRHIYRLHEMFKSLCTTAYYDFKILRTKEEIPIEDLHPLIAVCIDMQTKARREGKIIEQGEDLVHLYPDVVALMNHSNHS